MGVDRRAGADTLRMSSAPVHLRCAGFGKRFGDVTAVDRVDLEVTRGAFVVLLGASGCEVGVEEFGQCDERFLEASNGLIYYSIALQGSCMLTQHALEPGVKGLINRRHDLRQ